MFGDRLIQKCYSCRSTRDVATVLVPRHENVSHMHVPNPTRSFKSNHRTGTAELPLIVFFAGRQAVRSPQFRSISLSSPSRNTHDPRPPPPPSIIPFHPHPHPHVHPHLQPQPPPSPPSPNTHSHPPYLLALCRLRSRLSRFPTTQSLSAPAIDATGGLRSFGGGQRLGGTQRDPDRRSRRLRRRVGVVRRRDQG